LSGIRDLEWKCLKKIGQRFWSLFTGAQKICMLACLLCTINGEKGHTPFLEVVGDQEIYNFPIHY
jgi:hypothetical protein